jgi:hypothetical protein
VLFAHSFRLEVPHEPRGYGIVDLSRERVVSTSDHLEFMRRRSFFSRWAIAMNCRTGT